MGIPSTTACAFTITIIAAKQTVIIFVVVVFSSDSLLIHFHIFFLVACECECVVNSPIHFVFFSILFLFCVFPICCFSSHTFSIEEVNCFPLWSNHINCTHTHPHPLKWFTFYLFKSNFRFFSPVYNPLYDCNRNEISEWNIAIFFQFNVLLVVSSNFSLLIQHISRKKVEKNIKNK